jgi:hypothetical protein
MIFFFSSSIVCLCLCTFFSLFFFVVLAPNNLLQTIPVFVFQVEILGGGGTFSFCVQDQQSPQQQQRTTHKLLLSPGEFKSISLHCESDISNLIICNDHDDDDDKLGNEDEEEVVEVRDVSLVISENQHLCDSVVSTHSQTYKNNCSHDVDATLLIRASPYFKQPPSSSFSSSSHRQYSSSCCVIANDACARPFTIPLRSRYEVNLLTDKNGRRKEGAGVAYIDVKHSAKQPYNHHQHQQQQQQHQQYETRDACALESSLVMDDDQGVQDSSLEESFQVKSNRGHGGKQPSSSSQQTPPALQITPRQLLIVGKKKIKI